MNFADKILLVEKTDPDYAKAIKRLRFASWIFGIAVTLALIIAVQAFVINGKQGDTINNITHSACVKAYGIFGNKPNPDPKSVVECEAIRVALAKREGIVGPCILYQRASGMKGANCPKLYALPRQ
jgi:hypothetical protein